MRTLVPALAMVVCLSGCSAYERLHRMEDELREEVRASRMDSARTLERRMLDLSRNSYGPGTPEDTNVRTMLAEDWAVWRHSDKALAMAEETLDELESMYGPGDERVGAAWLSLARVHYLLRHWHETENALDHLAALCRPVFERTPRGTYGFSPCLTGARYDMPQYYLSVGAYRKWAQAYLFGDAWDDQYDYDGALSKLTVLGRGYAENGAYPEALAYLQRCVDELRPRYERNDPPGGTVWSTPQGDVELVVLDFAHSFHSQSPRCLEDLIEVRRRIGDDATASELERWQRELWNRGPELEAQLREEVARIDDYSWSSDYRTSAEVNDLAFYLANKGRTDEAIAAYEQAIALVDRALQRDGVFAGQYPAWLHLDELFGVAGLYESVGRFEDAEQTYVRAVAIAAADIHPGHAWHLEALAGLARSRLALGRAPEAAATWRRYLDVAERIRGSDHVDFAMGLAGIAEAEEAAGRRANAEESRRRAAAIRAKYARSIERGADVPMPLSLRSPPSPAN